jgi:hypothetical protein
MRLHAAASMRASGVQRRFRPAVFGYLRTFVLCGFLIRMAAAVQ